MRDWVCGVIVVIGVVLAAGCRREPATPITTTGSVLVRKAGNCPSALAGAVTKIQDLDTGVQISVTADDPETTAEIRKRAAYLVRVVDSKRPVRIAHSGQGTGSGLVGLCPIMTGNTTLVLEDIDGGVTIAIAPEDLSEVQELQREARRRQEEITRMGLDQQR